MGVLPSAQYERGMESRWPWVRITGHQGLHLPEAFAFYVGDSEKHQVPAISGLVLSQGVLGPVEQVVCGCSGS